MREIVALVESVAAIVGLICAFGVWTMDYSDRADVPGKVLFWFMVVALVTVFICEIIMKRWS